MSKAVGKTFRPGEKSGSSKESKLGPCPAADWSQKVDWKQYLDGLRQHCSQITAGGIFLINGDTLAVDNIPDIPTYKEIKKEVVPLFKNPVTLDHSEFHFFNFNSVRYRLDRVEKKSILRAETENEDIPMTVMKTPRGVVVLAIGNEDSLDDSGEKVATAVIRITNFLEMCGY
ncbi:Oidioi.mRNA.OKI2018_I69.PAR.g11907.t1.cds [Oikopleura dioica]|uniref:Oidioi.mRNA.OKI2018_I69.PAR.g11907.t1.cds n=1 Tax=Oikopleura dioica TaxID=34765 RepID=A0ABN7RYI0_OIKDI|nr:Oidioi.mRNA.OKI2018_I69.PAR.g11907.t1.cds [Oikopleura dioica]